MSDNNDNDHESNNENNGSHDHEANNEKKVGNDFVQHEFPCQRTTKL